MGNVGGMDMLYPGEAVMRMETLLKDNHEIYEFKSNKLFLFTIYKTRNATRRFDKCS